jgi:hypothetical protein
MRDRRLAGSLTVIAGERSQLYEAKNPGDRPIPTIRTLHIFALQPPNRLFCFQSIPRMIRDPFLGVRITGIR